MVFEGWVHGLKQEWTRMHMIAEESIVSSPEKFQVYDFRPLMVLNNVEASSFHAVQS